MLPDDYVEHFAVGTDKFGLKIWRSNGRGSMFCESVNSAWLVWVPPGTSSELHGWCLTLYGACEYNRRIRRRLGLSMGVGELTDWWVAVDTNAACERLGLDPRYPNLKPPAAYREGEIGLAGNLIKEFRQPAAVKAAARVQRLAAVHIPKRQLQVGRCRLTR